eukprot:TRINITY_DN7879_c0_g1_i5.p1 TRINITY_DN7879_c0_g1~~TRINITY_DN7879_c0_g1_i5.p1  ORF type:complete len:417 (-),score=52.93 TRINITY_DN7879_c0_g1_i5:158-1408(-)
MGKWTIHRTQRCVIFCIARRRRKYKQQERALKKLLPETGQPPPTIDYFEVLNRRYRGGCPGLFLAPMENLGDRTFRMSHAQTIGGFDEACTEFIRVPDRGSNSRTQARSLARKYNACELTDVPLGVQLMGSNPEIMGEVTNALIELKQPPRIDINCGCPANASTGSGAGSSLLKTPDVLFNVVKGVVEGSDNRVLVTVKLRSGFNDTSLFEDNLLAAQLAGASFVTVHPRTKSQGYKGQADWGMIKRAKDLLRIPVIGNGDILSVNDVVSMIEMTNCDAVMIGRGAVRDPLLFLRIRSFFLSVQNDMLGDEFQLIVNFLTQFYKNTFDVLTMDSSKENVPPYIDKILMGRLKQLVSYLFDNEQMKQEREAILQTKLEDVGNSNLFLELICSKVELQYNKFHPQLGLQQFEQGSQEA